MLRLHVQGSIKGGRMMWSCNIVRNCEMFWFGVTANITRDPASFVAIDAATWMVSDEAFCLEHCRRAPLLCRNVVVARPLVPPVHHVELRPVAAVPLPASFDTASPRWPCHQARSLTGSAYVQRTPRARARA